MLTNRTSLRLSEDFIERLNDLTFLWNEGDVDKPLKWPEFARMLLENTVEQQERMMRKELNQLKKRN